MEIPYTLTARPDTGLYNGKLGIWLFLASEVMLFGALFTAYLFMRIGAEDGTWPQHVLSVPIGLTNTLILIISSITMVWAWVALKERKFNTYRLALFLTILCGLAFLCLKGYEYYTKYEHWGLMIKEDAIAKYMPELSKMDAEVGSIPSQHVYEVNGDLEDWKPGPDGDYFLTHSQTGFTGNYVLTPVKAFHPVGYKAPAGTEESKRTPSLSPRTDVERAGPPPSRLWHLLRHLLYRHRSARASHHRWRGRDDLFPHHRLAALQKESRAALQPHRGHRHLLALRRSRLDHCLPHPLSHLTLLR